MPGVMDTILRNHGQESKVHPFFLFEPWDIEQRSEHIYEKAKADGFDLRAPDFAPLYGKDPRPFQSGYIQSDAFITAIFASNQSGKSYVALMDILVALTEQVPFALREKRGVLTKYKRQVTENNVRRFGRYSSETGEFIDHDILQKPNGLWDCGFVMGAGVYPEKKFARKGSKVWIVTYKEARDQSWFPLLRGMIPEVMLDTQRGSQKTPGFDMNDHIVHLKDGASIHFITYEQGATRLEAAGKLQENESLYCILFDEEPPNESFWATATQRVDKIRLVTTPYLGLTWTHKSIVQKIGKSKDIDMFHCIKYDCPYWTDGDVDRSKETIKKWEIGARVYGIHSESSGRPYYEEIYEQMQYATAFDEVFTPVTIYPEFVWGDEPRALTMRRDEIVIDEAVDPDARDVWKMFEKPESSHAYWMSIDTAEGTEDPSQEQDKHSAHLFRKPVEGEGNQPIEVACMDSSIPCSEFARLCMYAACAYNNALMAPECVGKSAGTFLNEADGYPFWYTMVVTNDITKKQTSKIGFHTSAKNRTLIFDLVGTFMKDHIENPSLGFRNRLTLEQAFSCIVGKNGRPDHAKRKQNDSLISYGIGLFVYKHAFGQIRNNSNAFGAKQNEKKMTFEEMARKLDGRETRPVLGSKQGMDSRRLKEKWRKTHGRT